MSGTERWAFAAVAASTSSWGPGLWTTEPSLVDEVLVGLQKLVPSARVKASDAGYEKMGIRRATFDRLQGLDYAVDDAIVAILCDLGWEPLSHWEFRRRFNSPRSSTNAEE